MKKMYLAHDFEHGEATFSSYVEAVNYATSGGQIIGKPIKIIHLKTN
jgi:hypothetical protein